MRCSGGRKNECVAVCVDILIGARLNSIVAAPAQGSTL